MQRKKFPFNIEDTVQVNTTMPISWKKKLEELAREQSVIEKKTVTYIDMIRRAIQKEYGL